MPKYEENIFEADGRSWWVEEFTIWRFDFARRICGQIEVDWIMSWETWLWSIIESNDAQHSFSMRFHNRFINQRWILNWCFSEEKKKRRRRWFILSDYEFIWKIAVSFVEEQEVTISWERACTYLIATRQLNKRSWRFNRKKVSKYRTGVFESWGGNSIVQ